MLRNRLYYALKPAIPWGLRVWLRRLAAKRILRQNIETWPCLTKAGIRPKDWPGWPDGKQFAFVLTHDVEGSCGWEKTPALMELETELGFRSSFNFIPEGSYKVTAEFLSKMKATGFEYGVHDLRHDGSLYSSKKEFYKQAITIRRYMKDWGTRGFRAGFMFHKLEWLHELEADYDLSTFDTDPFEPQPDPMQTIFPFWVQSPNPEKKGGFVEIPYTLPQDSTLYLILKELTPSIWLRKLDWIALNQGLALVNVHPDYMRLSSEDNPSRTYDPALYKALLEHVRGKYADAAWFALPSQVADYIKSISPAARSTS